MVFTTAGGGATQETGYEIDNSLRFNYPDNPQLSFTPSSDGNKRVATASFWLKRGVSRASNDLHIMGSQEDGSNLYSIRIRSSGNADVFQFLNAVSGSTSNGFTYKSTAAIRDHSAWYHFVVAMDVTQSDSNNGLKLYVNGVLQTSNTIGSYNQNVDVSFNTSGEAMKIGIKSDDSDPFDGYLADFHWIDGTQKQASDFGEYNDNGVWIPKEYDGSYGTNGFYLEFKQTGTSQNSSGIGADTSGNDNHFAVSNLAATDVTVDTPTNNFATILSNYASSETNPPSSDFSEGNTKFVASTSAHSYGRCSIGVSKGKWYAEFIAGSHTCFVGFVDVSEWTIPQLHNGYFLGYSNTGQTMSVGMKGTDGNFYNDNNSATGATFGNTDIISVALDMDNRKAYWAVNGTYVNSGNPATGANPVTWYTQRDNGPNWTDVITMGITGYTNTYHRCNFGGYSSVVPSSPQSDADGYGTFEYAPPSGYYALCTKNLEEYG